MKIEFEASDKKYIYIVIGVILFIVLSMFQYYANNDLSEIIKQKRKEAQTLQRGCQLRKR